VRVGDNPGFVGSQHDSIWNGISRVQENLDSQESMYTKKLSALMEARIEDLVKESLAKNMSEVAREMQIRDANQLRLEKQIKDLKAQALADATASASLSSMVGDLKQDVRHLRQDVSLHKKDIAALKLGSQGSLPTSFDADWKLVFDFFIRNTKPSSPPIVGGILEDSVRGHSSDIKQLSDDLRKLSTSSGTSTGPSFTNSLSGGGTGLAAPGAFAALETQVLDLKARMSSKAVTIGNYTFPTLPGTCAWASANLPSNADQANICVDVVVLLHSIGRAFATVDETRDEMYQNKRAGVSTMALTVASSFHTVLPQIMGKSKHATGQDSGLVLPCASKYSEWFDNSTGIPTGIKQQIIEGLDTQMAVYEEAIREMSYGHPVGAEMSSRLLRRAFDFGSFLLSLLDTMWTEYQGRSGEVGKEEAWLIICAVVRQLFRELRAVRRPGAAIIPGSPSSIGATWWYVLQTHRLMDEFTATGIRRHPSIIPVFTSHLDRNRVTVTTHAALADKVKRVEAAVTAVTTSVNRLNGARGNPGAGGRGAGAGTPP
jgi:hypothetical protein